MKKRKHLFNKAIFTSSLKSNYVSFLVVSLGNAFILSVVIFILSTLSINVTRDSMGNMFNSASMERTIKEAGVSLYLSYGESVGAYDDLMPYLGENAPKLYDGIKNILELKNGKHKAALDAIKASYNTLYRSSSNPGTDDLSKHEYAKTETIKIAETLVDIAKFDEVIKEMLPYFLDSFLDEYHKDKSLNNAALIDLSIDKTIENYAKDTLNLPDDQIEIIKEEIKEALKIVDPLKFVETSKKTTDNIIDRLSESLVDFYTIDVPSEILLDSYINDPTSYKENTIFEGDSIGYKDKAYIEVISEIMGTIFKDNYYLEALPVFTVNYLTNERGIPYYLEEKEINGETIIEEVLILDVKDRDKLVRVKEGMGKKSNLLEKQYKEILTGEKYTYEEIEKAHEDSESFYDLGKKFTSEFLNYFVNNKSEFYDSSTKEIKEQALINKVSEDLQTFSVPLILDLFEVNSLDELTKDKFGIDGKEIIDKVYNYSISSISVFKSEHSKCLEKGYDVKTSLLVAMLKASDTITDQLPEDIYIKLYDLTDRNLYGLVIGCMFFSMAGLLLPMVYAIMTSNSLVAEEVENGSLAFVAASPIKRSTIIFTKAFYQISMITAMFIILFLVGFASRQLAIAFGGIDFAESFTIKDLSLYTLGAYFVTLAISGICFLTSTFFNKTKYSLGVGGGLAIFFLVTSILGLFGLNAMPLALRIDSMNVFNYVTIIRLFDPQAIMDGSSIFYYKLLGLVAITIITYVTACIEFKRKDLPL